MTTDPTTSQLPTSPEPVPADAPPAGTPAITVPLSLLGDLQAVLGDRLTGVRGPTARAHLITLIVDAAAFSGLIPVWIDLPTTVATAITVGASLIAAGAHVYAWWRAMEDARAHQQVVAAPALGRHARP